MNNLKHIDKLIYNRLLSEFVGYTFNGNENQFLNYIGNWEFVISVLEKVENCRYVHETCIQYDDVFKKHTFTILPSLKDTFGSITATSSYSKKDAIVEGLVKFIKWYNKEMQ